MNIVLISLIATLASAGNQQDVSRDINTRLFQEGFKVTNDNKVESGLLEIMRSPESLLFWQSHGCGTMLLEDEYSKKIRLEGSERKKIEEVIKSLRNEKFVQEYYRNGGRFDIEANKKQVELTDNQRTEEILGLLNTDQRKSFETQLAMRAMCQFGLQEWLRANHLFDAPREQLFKQTIEKARKELDAKSRDTVVAFSAEIFDLVADKSQDWKAVIGKESDWLPSDPFLLLLQCQVNPNDLRDRHDIKELSGKLIISQFVFSIGINGTISASPDELAVAKNYVILLVSEDKYGGIDLTNSQRIELSRALFPSTGEYAELAVRLESLQKKMALEGYDAVKDEFIEAVNEVGKWSLERIENILLNHQKQALNTIIKRRIVGVCGLDVAIDLFVIPDLKNGPEIRRQLRQKREIYIEKITNLHKAFADEVWNELKKADPNLLHDIKQKAPNFRFAEIKNPSLLFRTATESPKK
jgi:hypothetical protein